MINFNSLQQDFTVLDLSYVHSKSTDIIHHRERLFHNLKSTFNECWQNADN